MLIRFTIVLMLLFFASCAARNGSYGYVVDGVSNKDKKDVQVVHLSHSRGAIFPAAYGKQFFSKDTSKNMLTCFTPDIVLIKKIELSIADQYCATIIRSEQLSRDVSEQELKRYEKNCPKRQKALKYMDKQYIGYISAKGEKIILINIIDFRKDPYHMKRTFTSSWILGFDGWFYTNVGGMSYNVNRNLFFVREKDI